MTEAQPVKRRPGRPRKNPLPAEAAAEVTPDSVAVETVAAAAAEKPAAKKAAPSDPADERIGQEADDPRYTAVVFPDGAQYRIEDGVIVERVN